MKLSSTATGLRLRNWSRIVLSIQVLVSGFAVMALEILGSRLIVPSYGSSTFTWGSIIGVVLAALAVGYHIGGRLADKHPLREVFSLVIFASGLLVVLLPFVTPFALAFSIDVSVSPELGAKYGPLLASTLVLAFPTAVLGMVSPFAIRIVAKDVSGLGKASGNLYSLSTVGSIIGALGATFILIPLFDLRTIIIGLGLVLMLVGLFWLPRLTVIFTVISILLLLQPLTPALSESLIHTNNVVYEKETPYARLDVVDSGSQRILYLNGLPQSAMDKTDPTKLVFLYTQYFHLGPAANPIANRVLFVGGGGFSGPKSFLATYPNMRVDVVEIDPDVIDTGYRYFSLGNDPRLAIFNEDARLYLSDAQANYDIIVLDAYTKTYVPFHLMTREFMELLSSHLTSNGIILSNLIGSLVGDTSDIIRAEYKTISTVFPDTAVFTTSASSIGSVQNLILFFDKDTSPALSELLVRSDVVERAATLPAPQGYPGHIYTSYLPTEDVPLLTDNYAPVESLLNPVTGRPYIIEQQYGRVASDFLIPSETTAYSLLIISLIGIAWSTYLLRKLWNPSPWNPSP